MIRPTCVLNGAVVLLCLVASPLIGEEPKSVGVRDLSSSAADYKLGGGDLLEISAYGIQSFSHVIRVTASGIIRIPLLGEIAVDGKTASQLERYIEDSLREGFIQEPTVSVFVKEYKARSVFVLGAVQQPGQYQIIKQLRVLDVITLAGGLTPDAGDELLIQRHGNGDGSKGSDNTLVTRIDVAALLDGSTQDNNVVVEDGDTLTIAQKIVDYYYVVGEVNGSGAFPLPEEGDILVSQALARAGGAMKTAKLKKGLLVRYDDNQQRIQSPINFPAIFQGEADDVALQANDIIFVPGSGIKSLGYAMLQVVPQTAQRAVIIR